MAGSQDDAAKTRIIAHMNNDHHDSVIRYLQHFGKLSAYTAYDSKMTDLSLTGFSLSCKGKTYNIPFEPPMKSLSEARERVVKIDQECRKALGQSDVTVKTYVPPEGVRGAVSFVIAVLLYAVFCQRWWFEPGQIAEQLVGAGAAKQMFRIQPYLFWGLLGVHALETVVLAQGKLKKHSVNPQSAIYWTWLGSNLIEGFPCALRFDRHVKKLAEKQKH